MFIGMSGDNFQIVVNHFFSFSLNVSAIVALVIILVLLFLLKALVGARRRIR